MFNVKWLRALEAVIVSQSVTEAARRLNVTQSAVSRMIASLEQELGLQLFSRQGGRLIITPQGEAFYVEVERALGALDEIARAGRNIRAGGGIRLRLFSMSPFVNDVIPAALAAFIAEFPDATVSLDIRGGRDSVTWDRGRRYDLGLIVLPQDERAAHTEAFARAPAFAAMSSDHRFAGAKQVGLKDLAQERLVMLPGTSLLRRWIDGRFAEIRQSPVVHLETSSMVSACEFAAAGFGVTIADPLSLYAVRATSLVARPLTPAMAMSYSFVLRPDQKPPQPVSRFMSLVKTATQTVIAKEAKAR